ncbi:MAG: FecR domain-containing protein, partial [Anaerolineae bacterium]|nr:FecR domain-containing protein [Anaerolineae bacterium]
MKYRLGVLVVIVAALWGAVFAQDEFAASLEVLEAGVTVQRVNTSNPIAVSVEAIVGVGDVIRTDAEGSARITFFADGTDVTLQPNTEYRIVTFSGGEENFNLTVEVLAGQALHRLSRLLGANSSYDVQTPGLTLAARGTAFAVRVEANGRSAMIVTEGTVNAAAEEGAADVPELFGVRAEVDNALSEVVPATSFAELDAALDGCAASITITDDVSLNIRSGPSRDSELLGTLFAEDITQFYGVNETGDWYRIMFEDGFGWVQARTGVLEPGCAGLRPFPDTFLEDGEAPTPDPTEPAATPTAT